MQLFALKIRTNVKNVKKNTFKHKFRILYAARSSQLALSLILSLGISVSSFVNAGCIMILGATPPPPAVSAGDNVGTYDCDDSGVCFLTDAHFDAYAAFTPLEPDEEEIDVGSSNINGATPGNTPGAAVADAGKKSGPELKLCIDNTGGGGGGGGGSGAPPTLPPVIATGRREVRTISVRPFYRPGGGNGGAPNGGSRASRDKPKEATSTLACSADRELRGAAARSAIINAHGTGMNRNGTVFIATTVDGYRETWMINNHAGSIGTALVNSQCPGGGSP
jgi:hypothetical protein